ARADGGGGGAGRVGGGGGAWRRGEAGPAQQPATFMVFRGASPRRPLPHATAIRHRALLFGRRRRRRRIHARPYVTRRPRGGAAGRDPGGVVSRLAQVRRASATATR